MSIKNAEINSAKLLESYLIKEKDLNAIREIGEILTPKLDELIQVFYAWLRTTPEYNEFFSDIERLNRVKSLQKDYWREFFIAQIDSEYIHKRQLVGRVHAKIGLSLSAYFTATNIVHNWITEQIVMQIQDLDSLGTKLSAVSKFIHFDTAIVVTIYQQQTNQRIELQSRSLMELSTPAIQVWPGIVMMPLIGVIDTQRASQITETLLQSIVENECRVAIVDVTGVPLIDTMVAQYIIKSVTAGKMLGAEILITGISPETAQTLTGLGITLKEFNTAGTLRDGLAQAMNIVNS